jgi:hypothetical protein
MALKRMRYISRRASGHKKPNYSFLILPGWDIMVSIMKRIFKIHIFAVAFNALLLGNCIRGGIGKYDLLYYFNEGEAVTFFSAVFLGITSYLAWLIGHSKRLSDRGLAPLNFWILSSFGFFYLMLDEFFMFHEGMDRALLTGLGFEKRALNFDGAILGIFGLLALALIYQNRRSILSHKDFVHCLYFAFICFVGMVITDLFEDQRIAIEVIDESFKMVGVTYFLMAYTSVLMDQLKSKG